MRRSVAAALALAMAGPAAAAPGGALAVLSDARPARQLDPLAPGGARNPLRAGDPAAQAALVGRLRCADGAAPRGRFVSNIGLGVHGAMVALWEVACDVAPGRVALHLDAAAGPAPPHAPPGFALAAP